jgi:hypothetical protein
MKRTLVILGVLFSLSTSAQQVAKNLTASNGEYIGFWEYKPTDYNTGTKYPVIINLHGIGERGNGYLPELDRAKAIGIPQNISNGHTMRFFWNGKWETFLVLSPQLNSKYGWWPPFYVDEMINYATRNLSIDPNRIFLTGLSLGGGGTWTYVLTAPENAKKLAGIGVTCGTCQSGNYSYIAQANLPVWAWHAADDGTVGAGCSSSAINNINAANPAVAPYLTIWPSGQHWIWGRVYNTDYEAQHPNIYEWFLGQNKSLPVNRRPVANAGADQTISKLTGTVTLTGAGSSDPDGNIVQYVWTKVSGPSYGAISAAVSAGSTTLVTGLTTPGTYVYELRVIDNRADWTVDQVTITVSDQAIPDPSGNKIPVASAGGDVSISLPTNSANLNGGGSDPDGYITSYSWAKVAGPSQFTLNNGGSAAASVTNLAQGTYTFRLTVRDNNNATNTDDINITVNGTTTTPAKIANAGPDVTVTLPNAATLNASASTDPAGAIKQYEWIKVSGPSQYSIANVRAANTTVSNLVQGTYQFRVVVWDHDWVPTTDTMTLTVNPGSGGGSGTPGNIANAGADFTVALPNSGTLNGSASYDPAGAIKQYEWKYVSGPSQYTIGNIRSATTTLSNLVAGTYVFKVVVWDHVWVPYEDFVTVTATTGGGGSGGSGNGSISNAGADIYLTLPTNSTTLNGSASNNPDGVIKAYEWNKISGPSQFTLSSPKAASSTLGNLVQGVYQFRLTVWNHNWIPYHDTVSVIVQGTSGGTRDPKSWSNAGSDIFITLPVNSTTLDGSASANPAGGELKAFEWRKISGPSQYTIANWKSVTTALTNLAQGTYSFELRVWNKDWVPYPDTVNVVVMGGTTSAAATIGTTEAIMSTRTTGAGETVVDKLTVYPNPAHGLINVQAISAEAGKTVINIYDVTGKNVQTTTFEKAQSLQQRSLNVTRLAPGVYHLEVIINNKKKMITKFIKQ